MTVPENTVVGLTKLLVNVIDCLSCAVELLSNLIVALRLSAGDGFAHC